MNSGFDINNVYWYACLHLDSLKNYNFHFFFMEKKKTKYKHSDRLIPKSAIKKFKSNALNYLINRNDILKLKDELFINVVKDVQKNNLTIYDKSKIFNDKINKKLDKLYRQLPKEHRLQYSSPNLNKVRPLIDEIIYEILSHPNVVNDYYRYIEKLYDIDFENKKYYGDSKNNNYVNSQIQKLYSRIGNYILTNYKGYKSEKFLDNQREFLSKNIFKLKLKSKNNITENQKLNLGLSLYKIANYYNLTETNKKKLIKNWYYNSRFSNFKTYYKTLLNNTDYSKPLTTTEFYKTFKNMGISDSKYNKLRNSFYTKRYLYNYMIQNAINHIMYENERIEKEIEYSMKEY